MLMMLYDQNLTLYYLGGSGQKNGILVHDSRYRKVSNIRRTKCQNLKDSRLILQLSVPNPLKRSVKSVMKM